MSKHHLSTAGEEWLQQYSSAAGNECYRVESIDDEAFANFIKLDHDDRLLVLHQLTHDSLVLLVRMFNGVERDATIFGGNPELMLDVQIHDDGPEFDYDWSTFSTKNFAKANLQGLMIMARRAYELQGSDGNDPELVGPSCTDFANNGFTIKFYGRENPEKKRNSTQAFIARKDNFAILTFRGSTFSPFNVDDFIADAFFLRGPGYSGNVHRGFANALDEIWSDLKIDLLELAASGTEYLHITGHSLGASLSFLAAMRLFEDVPQIKIASVVPFAAARVFDSQAAKAYSDILGDVTYRVVNTTDIVPMIPFHALGFRHPDSHVVYIDSDGLLRLDPTKSQIETDRDIANWDESRFLKSLKSTKYPSLAWLDPVRMHWPLAYLQPLYINHEYLSYDTLEVLDLIDKAMNARSRARQSFHLEAAVHYLLPLTSEQRAKVIKYLAQSYCKRLIKWLTDEHLELAIDHYLRAYHGTEADKPKLREILVTAREQLGKRITKRKFTIFG